MLWMILACDTATELDKGKAGDDDDTEDTDSIFGDGPGDDDDDDDDDDTDDTDVPPCTTNGVVSAFPEDGTNDAYYRTTIEFEMTDPEAAASISVTGPGGPVAGTTTHDDALVIFEPNTPLDPDADYEATFDFSCGSPTIEFSTSEVGDDVDADFDSLYYTLDIASGRFLAPAGVGPLLQQQLEAEMLLSVEDYGGGDMDFLLTMAEPGTNDQDLCVETLQMTASWSEPYFSFGPQTTTFDIDGFAIELQDFSLSGAFSPDGDYIQGIEVEGLIDTRPLVPLVDDQGDDDSVCELVATFGVPCLTCPDGGDFCLRTHVDSIEADSVNGTLVVRTSSDIANDVDCDGGGGSLGCSILTVLPVGGGTLLLAGLAVRTRRED